MISIQRWLLAAYGSLLIGACAAFGLLAWDQSRQFDMDLTGFRMVASITSGNSEQWAFTFLLFIIAAFGALTIMVALFPAGQPKRGLFRLRQADGSTVDITAEALEALLTDELERLPDVRKAWPRVRLAGGVMQPDVLVVVYPSATIAHVAAAVSHLTVQTLKERVGLTAVNKPGLHITYEDVIDPEATFEETPPPPPPPPPLLPRTVATQAPAPTYPTIGPGTPE